MTKQHGVVVEAITNLPKATRDSDIVVTCTTSHAPFLKSDDIRPGTFIAAVGADNPEKSEIAPDLMARSKVTTDTTAQASMMGDLHHAIRAGVMTERDVYAQLGDLITGRMPGRTNQEEITLFDSTGLGIQDVAASARAYVLAEATATGTSISISGSNGRNTYGD